LGNFCKKARSGHEIQFKNVPM